MVPDTKEGHFLTKEEADAFEEVLRREGYFVASRRTFKRDGKTVFFIRGLKN